MIYCLKPHEATFFTGLTFETSRPLLGRCSPGGSAVAVGAQLLGRPVGLALAELHPIEPTAVLRSIAVAPAQRGQGMGSKLLQALEQQLQARGIQAIGAIYVSDAPGFLAFDRLLARNGWEAKRLRMRLGRFHVNRISTIPWLNHVQPGAEFEVFPWQELTLKDEAAIRAWSDFPVQLTPFSESALIDRDVSVGLRVRASGAVVGWMITHRVLPDTLRYSALYLRPEVPLLGRGLCLIAASIQRQDRLRAECPRTFTGVAVSNEAMSHCLLRRLAPFAESMAMSYEARKAIGN